MAEARTCVAETALALRIFGSWIHVWYLTLQNVQGVPLATEPGISLIILPIYRYIFQLSCVNSHITLTLTNNSRIV